MKFQLLYNEVLNLWTPCGPKGEPLTAPMRLAKLTVWLGEEVKLPEDRDPRWSKPIDHKVRRKRTLDDQVATYEIVGKKVQRIAFDRDERKEQQMEELAALLEIGL